MTYLWQLEIVIKCSIFVNTLCFLLFDTIMSEINMICVFCLSFQYSLLFDFSTLIFKVFKVFEITFDENHEYL